MIKVGSAFSGVGGLDLPFQKDDKYEIVFNIEFNKHCSAVLKYHQPDVPNMGDITEVVPNKVHNMDVFLAGFPCKSISIQGDQTGIFGEGQSRLFHYLPPIIKEKLPKIVLLENVKNLLSKQMSKDLNYVKNSIQTLGYNSIITEIDSSEYGTSQQRVRAILLFIRKDIKFNESDLVHVLEQHIKSENNEAREKVFISYSKSGRKHHVDYRIRTDNKINTLVTGRGCVGQSTGTLVIEGGVARLLTVNECEKLMTWPINHTKLGIYDGVVKEVPENARYEMCGNGVVSSCITPFKEFITLLLSK